MARCSRCIRSTRCTCLVTRCSRCTRFSRCTCLACTSTCASRGDFPYKSPEIRPKSAESARLVHRITVPHTFPRACQTCTWIHHSSDFSLCKSDLYVESPFHKRFPVQARLVHRITVPQTFPCASQTCTITARGQHHPTTTRTDPSAGPM